MNLCVIHQYEVERAKVVLLEGGELDSFGERDTGDIADEVFAVAADVGYKLVEE